MSREIQEREKEVVQSFTAPSWNRNPKIMFIFNQLGLAEQRGFGLRSMKELNAKRFPLPVFEMNAGQLQVTFGRTKDFIAEISGIENIDDLSAEDKTAQRRLADMIELGVVEVEGEKRWTKYKLKQQRNVF